MENEFCEIDFTTATAWENFNARLEEIFYSWKLYQPTEDNAASDKGDGFVCDLGCWSVNSERVEFDGKEFDISYFRKITQRSGNDSKDVGKNETETVEENVADEDDGLLTLDHLPIEINCLSRSSRKFGNNDKLRKLIRLYDLTDFVLLTSENSSAITLETHVKLLMSSFCISAFNTRCYLPMFAQVFQEWQNCFVGVRVDEDGFRVDYQMIHLGKIPSKFNYFSGVLELFKSRISSSLSPNSVWASVKLSYSVSKFTNFAWPRFKRPISVDDASEEPVPVVSFELPFGAACEPVNEIRLHVTWPKVFENMVMDNENHSDFDPQNALNWALQVFPKDTQHLLSQHIGRFTQMCQSSSAIHDLIGDLLKRRHFNDLNVPTNLSISRIIPGVPSGNNSANAAEVKRSKRFLPEETLVSMLYYLFPDADENNTYPYSSKFEDCREDASLKGMKTCGMDELPWRLSIVMCIIAHLYGGHATAQFWYEFTQELRFRWEKGMRILGVLKGVPNHKTSLINQKLQMLNCCIQKKIKRENKDATSEDSDTQAQPEKFESEDEEFFECESEHKEMRDDNFKVARVSLWNQPEGRLRKFNNLKLIETGDFMYIPITQEMTPKTEDQLEDDAVVLMKLGSDSQGSKLRARMMCASLYSDMESFKAANPGAVLEDFIRWYSPRDWIEDDDGELDKFGQRKGKLSNRMLLPGNMWREVWDTSIPVPACRQKCLFDDTKESEKVLHFFESYKHLGDIFSLLLPTLIHAALHTIIDNETVTILRRYSPTLDEKINALIQKAVAATRNITVDVSYFKAVVDDICEIETLITRYKSVEFKLFPGDLSQNEEERNMLIELVLGKGEIKVPKGPSSRLGRRITYLFSKESEDAVQIGDNAEKKKDDNASIVSATNEFFHSAATSFNTTISHHQVDKWNTRTCPPYQKEFALNVAAPLPHVTSRVSSHGLTAHICSEEIFIASYFGRDLLFV